MNRTDLACEVTPSEGITSEFSLVGSVEISKIVITAAGLTKPPGSYYTLFCPDMETEDEISALSQTLIQILPDTKNLKILVVGLGNENITPDSLGVRSAGKVLATGHLKKASRNEFDELGLREVYVVAPGVMAQTGLESVEFLKLLADGIKPDCLIVIDSLACGERSRLGSTIQLTDTGISPGSGVKNERKEFSQSVFGVPVVAVGVPTVIDINEDLLVPRNIDVLINHFARIISAAFNKVLNPNLDESDIEKLLI
jgi:spore protease